MNESNDLGNDRRDEIHDTERNSVTPRHVHMKTDQDISHPRSHAVKAPLDESSIESSISACLRSLNPRFEQVTNSDDQKRARSLGQSQGQRQAQPSAPCKFAGILHATYRLQYRGAPVLEEWLREPDTVSRLYSYCNPPKKSRSTAKARAGAGKASGDARNEVEQAPNQQRHQQEIIPRIHIDLQDILMLDIETLGLKNAAVVIIGFASFQNGEIAIDQFILTDPTLEGPLLTRCLDFIRFLNPKMLVTFYGSKFDVPFLIDRAGTLITGTSATGTSVTGTSATGTSVTGTSATGTSVTGTSASTSPSALLSSIEKEAPSTLPDERSTSHAPLSLQEETAAVFFGMKHLDLHAIFKSLITGLPKYNFQAMECHVLDIVARKDDISGAEVLPIYQAFLEASSVDEKARLISRIIKHNFLDLVHSAFAFHAIVGKVRGSPHDDQSPTRVSNLDKNVSGEVDTIPSLAGDVRFSMDYPARGPGTPAGAMAVMDTTYAMNAMAVPRAKPIVLLQGEKTNGIQGYAFTGQEKREIARVLGRGLNIHAIQAALKKANPDIYTMFERGGWFMTLEQLCVEGVLERRETGDDILYQSAHVAPEQEGNAGDHGNQETLPVTPVKDTRGAGSTSKGQDGDLSIQDHGAIVTIPNTGSTSTADAVHDEHLEPTMIQQPGPVASTSPHEDGDHPSVGSQDKSRGAPRVFVLRSLKSFQASRNIPVRSLRPEPARDDPPRPLVPGNHDAVSFNSIVFHNTRLQDIIRGWLASCGELNINDAAAALNVPGQDIMLYVFDQAGKGLINVRFKDNVFHVPSTARATSFD